MMSQERCEKYFWLALLRFGIIHRISAVGCMTIRGIVGMSGAEALWNDEDDEFW